MPATAFPASSLSIQPAKSSPTVSPANNTSARPKFSPISTPSSPALQLRKSLRVNKADAVVGIRATSERAIRRCARTDDKRQFFLLELSRELSPIIAGEPIGHTARKEQIGRAHV